MQIHNDNASQYQNISNLKGESKMINKSKLLYILSFMIAMFIGCEDTNEDPAADTTLETPTSYVFQSRFN